MIIEYQKITNLLGNAQNRPSKFRTKNWVEVNDKSRGMYDVDSQIKFKTLMLRSILYNYSDVHILEYIYSECNCNSSKHSSSKSSSKQYKKI